MNLEFIRRAERVTTFNITPKEFTTLQYKAEIQHLFNKHFFPNFDVTQTIKRVDKDRLNNLITQLKQERGGTAFEKLHTYNLKGVGPGEATLFFLIDDAYLGGGSSAGVDVIVGTSKYEVKAVQVTPTRVASDFKLGGNVPIAEVMSAMDKLRVALKLGGTKTEISKAITETMRQKAPVEFKAIQDEYAERAYEDYFKNHEVIFINNSSGPRVGTIEAVKRVTKADIMIERATSGTVKPKVQL